MSMSARPSASLAEGQNRVGAKRAERGHGRRGRERCCRRSGPPRRGRRLWRPEPRSGATSRSWRRPERPRSIPWAAFSETRRLWRAFRGRIRFGSGAEAVVRCNRRGGRGGGQVGDSAMKSAESGAGRQRRPGGWWGQASSMSVRKFSHSTNACRSVDAERNRGYKNPGHPIRTLFRPCGRRRHCSHACPCRGRRFHLVSGTSATLVALAPDLVSRGHCQHAALAAGFLPFIRCRSRVSGRALLAHDVVTKYH